MKRRNPLWACVAGFAVLLAGTIGGCDQTTKDHGWILPPPVEDESLPGVYLGTIVDTSGANPVSYDVVGMVDANHNVQVIFPLAAERHMAGVVQVNATTLTGTLTEYIGAQAPFIGTTGVGNVSLDGSARTSEWLVGDYTTSAGQGEFSLDYQMTYERGSSPGHVAGVWLFEMAAAGGGLYTLSLDIDNNGVIIGTDTYGCIFAGRISTIDPNFNLYRVDIDVTACFPFDGPYSGLAFLEAVRAAELNRMTLAVSNNVHAYASAFQKQP